VAAHRLEVPVILNLAPARVIASDILRQVTVLIVNEGEASSLYASLLGLTKRWPRSLNRLKR